MTDVTAFMFQGAGPFSASAITQAPYDLVLVETGVTSNGGAVFTPGDVDDLTSDGRTVLGYVNAIVLDENRAYYGAAGLSDPDTGPFTGSLPSWLDVDGTGHPLASNIFGAFADIRDPAWVQIVVDQAIAIVAAGYDGVFLDDVGTYFELDAQRSDISLGDAALAMMRLVNAVADAIGPDKSIVINRGVDIFDHAAPHNDGTADEFRANVDGLLMEAQIATGAWARADDFDPDTWLLSIEVEGNLSPAAYSEAATAQGVIPFMPPSDAYNTVPPAPLPGDPGGGVTEIRGTAEGEVIYGTDGDDLIFARGGDDTIYGFGGDDTIIGGGGTDLILGGDGRDDLRGGAGADTLVGGAQADTISGNGGRDILFGNGGRDVMFGRAGNDTLFGGQALDTLEGGTGTDLIDEISTPDWMDFL